MPDKFRIYSTDIAPTLDPDSFTPATNIVFDQDPHHGTYEPASAQSDRGSIIKTFGGTVVQDLGIAVTDEVIFFEDTDAIVQATVTALQTAYEVVDGEWYFTDGYECWKVKFSRNPRGFNYFRNLIFAQNGFMTFSYSCRLLVLSKEL